MRVVHAVDPRGFKPPSRRNVREGRASLISNCHAEATRQPCPLEMPVRDL